MAVAAAHAPKTPTANIHRPNRLLQDEDNLDEIDMDEISIEDNLDNEETNVEMESFMEVDEDAIDNEDNLVNEKYQLEHDVDKGAEVMEEEEQLKEMEEEGATVSIVIRW